MTMIFVPNYLRNYWTKRASSAEPYNGERSFEHKDKTLGDVQIASIVLFRDCATQLVYDSCTQMTRRGLD